MRLIFGALVLINSIGILYSQNADGKDENATAIQPTDKIRRSCVIREDIIDCSYQGLSDFFTEADWLGIKDENVTTVDLSGNNFTTIHKIPELEIKVFNLSRCNINTIDAASFKDLQNLTTLDLSYNNLTTAALNPHVFEGRYAPTEFEPLVSMKHLDLSYNLLHSLHQDLFEHVPELTELRLNGNILGMIDHVTLVAISSLPMLVILELSKCDLAKIPDGFLHTLRNLEFLDLSENALETVPDELEEAKNLRYLNLNKNPIVRIQKGSDDNPPFPYLPSLQELHMCNMNELKFVSDEGLGGMPNLRILYMNNNENLEYLGGKMLAAPDKSGESYIWPDLDELHLQNSNISYLDRSLVEKWEDLEVIDISFNPLLCDCTTQWTVDYLVPLMEKLKPNTTDNLICKMPVEMSGKTLHELQMRKSQMRCLDKYNRRPERDGAMLIGTLIGVLLSVPIILSVLLLWRRGYFACCGVKGPADYSRAFYKRARTDELNM